MSCYIIESSVPDRIVIFNIDICIFFRLHVYIHIPICSKTINNRILHNHTAIFCMGVDSYVSITQQSAWLIPKLMSFESGFKAWAVWLANRVAPYTLHWHGLWKLHCLVSIIVWGIRKGGYTDLPRCVCWLYLFTGMQVKTPQFLDWCKPIPRIVTTS